MSCSSMQATRRGALVEISGERGLSLMMEVSAHEGLKVRWGLWRQKCGQSLHVPGVINVLGNLSSGEVMHLRGDKWLIPYKKIQRLKKQSLKSKEEITKKPEMECE